MKRPISAALLFACCLPLGVAQWGMGPGPGTPHSAAAPSWALLAHTATGSAGTTSAINTTGANMILLYSAFDGSPTISDSKGNTWTPLNLQSGGAGNYGRFWVCYNPTVGAGHTFTTSTGYAALFAAAFSGSGLVTDQQNGTYTSGTVTSPLQPGSITPTTANQLVVTGVSSAGAESGDTIDSGFTITDSIAGVNGVTYGGSMGYKIQTSATAVDPQWTASAGGYGSSVVASFK